MDKITIVMVGTTHSGNIGAAARAMNNMCFSRLALVAPECKIDQAAYARASGANRILDEAIIYDCLEAAVANCEFVVAASARKRSLTWPELDPNTLALELQGLPSGSRSALVFGREHSGLTNEELQICNAMLRIPTNPDFCSLNVASAIQVVCYEIFRQSETETDSAIGNNEALATSSEMEGYFDHLEQVLEGHGFIDPQQPGQVIQRLRRLYLRSGVTRNEINILRGILTAVGKRD